MDPGEMAAMQHNHFAELIEITGALYAVDRVNISCSNANNFSFNHATENFIPVYCVIAFLFSSIPKQMKNT
jgi:hypothetical protein